MVGVPTNRQAFLVGEAWLFDVDIHVPNRAYHTHGFVLCPSGVCIRNEALTGAQHGSDSMNAFNVGIGIAADLQLKPRVALGAIAGYFACHGFRGLLRDGSIESNAFTKSSAHQNANRQPSHLAKNVPARDIDSGLDIRVPF